MSTESHQAASSGSCPFLAALPRPPKAPWHTKPLSVLDIYRYQDAVLPNHGVLSGSFLMMDVVITGNANTARSVLVDQNDDTMVGWPSHFGELFGSESMVLKYGEEYKSLRSLMQPAFTAEAVYNFT